MKVDFKLSTNGSGYWSKVEKQVQCIRMEVNSFADGENEFGELRVYFDTASWNPNTDGLIYTDKQFLKELHAALNDAGFEPEEVDDVSYSEAGMQGPDYVSFDVCELFLTGYRRVTGRY